MKKSILTMLLLAAAMIINAVPAKRGWQTRTQADGTTIEVQQIGDEFYHYTINREGKQVTLTNGMYEVVGEAPTAAMVKARRAQSRRARQEFGVSPNLAPRGIVIMVNFSDKSFAASHTREVVDSLCNAVDCKVNKYGSKSYPSAGHYFMDQSNGKYHPVFDVYGPVTLSQKMAYYGANDSQGNDIRPAVAVVEACKQLESTVDFTLYDSDNDGKIDFVYMIYAGTGEHATENKNEIWPHAFSIDEEFEYKDTNFTDVYPTKNDCKVDGKQVNTYACSAELSGSDLDGIGTLCHEFSHVMGLPDFYDTEYGTNYEQQLTPNEWNIMDGGSYNGDGHCPPNYDPWEKYFMGWLTPENLGSAGRSLTLEANGTDGYQAYQINASGQQEEACKTGLNYYIENRQQQGWDEYLPAAGMVIWKVDYNTKSWTENTPNNTANRPLYTLVCPSGNKVGANYGSKNVWPYNSTNSWSGVNGKPLKDITRVGDQVQLIYIEDVKSYPVQWMVNGELLESREYNKDGSEDLTLPTKTFEACEDTKFIGWTTHSNWCDPFTTPDDLFSEAQGKVTAPATYYAVFE